MANSLLKLKSFRKRNDLFYPDLQRNISQILPSALTLFNYKFPNTRTLLPYLQVKEGWKKLQETKIRNILFITIDALGYFEFMAYSKQLKEKFQSNGLCISSVFPTITSTCIASLKYGEMPVNHGIVGHKINIPEIGNIVDTLTLKAKHGLISLPFIGVNVKDWVWSDFPYKCDEDLAYYRLIENHIANSGLSFLVSPKIEAIGHSSHVDCFAAAQNILEKSCSARKIVDIYIGSVDHVTHRYTTKSEVLQEEISVLEQVLFRMLQRLNSKVAAETVVVLTADHGQETLTKENKIMVTQEEEEELSSLIRDRGRSGRVIHLYSKEGKQQDVVDWFEEKVGEKGVVVTTKEYPALMGKGADNQRVVDRLGDVQVILGENASLYFGHLGEYDHEFNLGLNATHGSLSMNELLVPLIFGNVPDIIE
jgi:hypothetical protein